MSNFEFRAEELKDVFLITPFRLEDGRGDFIKKFEYNIFLDEKINFNLSEHFITTSKKGVLRGMHFQKEYPQSKIVSVIAGEILDVIIDLRKSSSTFGKWKSFYLDNLKNKLLYVPKGFAHGFLTISDEAIVSYLCDGKYIKEFDDGIIWDDKTLDIDWKLERIGGVENLLLSERDRQFLSFDRNDIYYP